MMMGLWMLLFWGGIAAVMALAVRGGRSGPTGEGYRAPGPLVILEQRFARGEISEAEFRERRRVLSGDART